MSLVRKFIATAAAGLMLVLSAYAAPSSAAWAITPHWEYGLEGSSYHTGNTICLRQWAGTYGNTSLFFSQTVMRVNYGGSCNANWPRPAGELKAHSWIYGPNTTLQSNSYEQSNSSNSHIAQANAYRWTSSVKVVSRVKAEPPGYIYQYLETDVY